MITIFLNYKQNTALSEKSLKTAPKSVFRCLYKIFQNPRHLVWLKSRPELRDHS